MQDDLKPYPAYKDSGVLWLGQVPEHWQTRRIKHVAALDPSKSEVASVLSADDLVTFLPMQRVSSSGLVDSQESRRVSDVWNGFTYFRRSDVLVAKITPCFENGKGACLDSLPTEIGFGSTEFIVLRSSRAVLPRYLYRLTTVSAFRHLGADAMMGAAGQQRVPTAFVSNFEMPVPPLPEQAAIVRYLDHADRKVRHAIRARQRLITLLTEQKQAIIQRAVTRGLDTLASLRSLGSAPDYRVNARWPIIRMSRICRIRCETGAPDLDLLSVFLDSGVIPYGKGRGQVHKPSLDLTRYQIVHCGDLVLNNQQAWRGSVGVSQYYGIISPAYVVLCLDESLDPHFADYLFRSDLMVDQYVTSSKGVGDIQRDVYVPWLKHAKVPVPPIGEQRAISAKLDRVLASINRELAARRDEIDLLREYRTRLIADVVTGKLDVRDAATHLPDELEEQSEPPDEEPADDAADLESEEEGNGEQTES